MFKCWYNVVYLIKIVVYQFVVLKLPAMKKTIIPVLLMVVAAVSVHCEADSPLTLNASLSDSAAVITDTVIADTTVIDTIITDTTIIDTAWIPVDSVQTPVDSVVTDTTWIPETPVDSTDTAARNPYKRRR